VTKKKKIRTEFRKNRLPRVRTADLTRKFAERDFVDDSLVRQERVSGKGELTRKRTVVVADDGDAGTQPLLDVEQGTLAGRVLAVHGLASTVESDQGGIYKCATRRLLKTLATDHRHVVAAGDRVLFRTAAQGEGWIERVEPRHGVLCRASRMSIKS
jgi:ribosome biogenesis GTPase